MNKKIYFLAMVIMLTCIAHPTRSAQQPVLTTQDLRALILLEAARRVIESSPSHQSSLRIARPAVRGTTRRTATKWLGKTVGVVAAGWLFKRLYTMYTQYAQEAEQHALALKNAQARRDQWKALLTEQQELGTKHRQQAETVVRGHLAVPGISQIIEDYTGDHKTLENAQTASPFMCLPDTIEFNLENENPDLVLRTHFDAYKNTTLSSLRSNIERATNVPSDLLLLKIENKELSQIDDLLAVPSNVPSKRTPLTKKVTAEFISQDHANKFNNYLESYRDIYDKKSPSIVS